MSPERRRDMVIRAALPLIAERGAAVTTQQIARAAGIGEATIFRVFPDKETLLDACIAEALDPSTVLEELRSISLEQPLADRLAEAVDALRAHVDRIGTVIGALHASGHRHTRPAPGDGPGPSRDKQRAVTHAAVAELFAPDRDGLRFPLDVVTDAFLTRSRSDLPPAELVDLFLRGAVKDRDITLNHTIVPARDNEEAAREFAEIMGLIYEGPHRHFAPVRVNDGLTIDFMTVEDPQGHHLAFDVPPDRFDAILDRLRARGVPYGGDPAEPDNGRTDHPFAARGVLFRDSSRNLWEIMTTL
jgi:AcrR family transcriptional regulator